MTDPLTPEEASATPVEQDAAEAAQPEMQRARVTPPTTAREIAPGDPSVWEPQSFSEWEALAKTRTFLAAWSGQTAHERVLRSLVAKVIFTLIGVQVVGVFGIVILAGLDILTIEVAVLQVLIPSVLADVFGLGFVVAKYLFSQPLRHGLDALVRGKEGQDGT